MIKVYAVKMADLPCKGKYQFIQEELEPSAVNGSNSNFAYMFFFIHYTKPANFIPFCNVFSHLDLFKRTYVPPSLYFARATISQQEVLTEHAQTLQSTCCPQIEVNHLRLQTYTSVEVLHLRLTGTLRSRVGSGPVLYRTNCQVDRRAAILSPTRDI